MSVSSVNGPASVRKPRYNQPKMDLARATGLMGFNSGRWLDTSQTGSDPKTELDKALFNRMQDLMKKRRQMEVSSHHLVAQCPSKSTYLQPLYVRC